MADKTSPEGESSIPEGKESKTVSYESYQKLLSEKKKTQQQFEELKALKEQAEQNQLEAEGKYKELNENLKKANEKLKTQQLDMAKKVQEKVVYQYFAREAEKLGCQDPKLAYMSIDLSDVEVTEDFELNKEKLTEKIGSLTKEKPFLFKKEVQMPNDINPSKTQQPVNLQDVAYDDLKSMLATAQ